MFFLWLYCPLIWFMGQSNTHTPTRTTINPYNIYLQMYDRIKLQTSAARIPDGAQHTKTHFYRSELIPYSA